MPMSIEICCVSKRPPGWAQNLIDDYIRRAHDLFKISYKYVAPAPDRMSSAEALRDEGHRLLRALPRDTHLVALAVDGRVLDSEAMAKQLGNFQDRNLSLALVIGGANGLSPDVLAAAQSTWSLSALTLPHMLVQVVLAEQLYRAWSILRRHPYHLGH